MPLAEATAFMHRELTIIKTMHVIAVARARDVLGAASSGPSKKQAWGLAGEPGGGLERIALL